MKRFPNLLPGDTIAEVPAFRLVLRNTKWVTVSDSGVEWSASGRYLFTTAEDGTVFVSRRFSAKLGRAVGHADLTNGRDVNYAGEIQFSGRTNRGTLRWWNNDSGHYQPDEEHSHQAGLPIALFQPYVF